MKLVFSDFNEFDNQKMKDSVFLDNHSYVDSAKDCYIIDHHLCNNPEAVQKIGKNAKMMITPTNRGSNTLMLWELYLNKQLGDTVLNANALDWTIYTHSDADGFFSAYVWYRLASDPSNDIDVQLAVTLGQIADMGEVNWNVSRIGAYSLGNSKDYKSDWSKLIRILKSYFKTHGTSDLNQPIDKMLVNNKNSVFSYRTFSDMVQVCAEKRNPFGYLEFPGMYDYHYKYLDEITKIKDKMYVQPSMSLVLNIDNVAYKTKIVFIDSPYDVSRSMIQGLQRTFNKNEAMIWGMYNHGLKKLSLHSDLYHAAFKLGVKLGGGGHNWGQDGTPLGGSLGSTMISFDDLNKFIMDNS